LGTALLAAGVVAAVTLPSALAKSTPPPAPVGMPAGVPAAALTAQPTLPRPAAWPFPEAFPRTSGTGREAGGALEWTDFLYDDHGATGIPQNEPYLGYVPTIGTYVYPAGPAAGNGADLFRIGIGLDATSTWWRIDWNTLIDPNVPIAEFTFDKDRSTATGASAWPGGAGISSPGIDQALLISARGAWLIDPVSGARQPAGQVIVDRSSRSFVVRVPRALLTPSGMWRIRVASGLANARGDGFRPIGQDLGALPGEPAVYNVGFRTYDTEPIHDNIWMEMHQAEALTTGDVSGFSTDIAWNQLAAHITQPEPQPRGASDRWYVTGHDLGQGVPADLAHATGHDPTLLGRVQPYGVYVPRSVDLSKPAPLTWLLHSSGLNHNQYLAVNPTFVQQACEQRASICATPAARGPDIDYFGLAQVDVWNVWHDLSDHFLLDPQRTVLSGYSLGGTGTNRIGLAHPDLFARFVVLSGAEDWGANLENARWVPYYISNGAADELVPVYESVNETNALDALGYRYRYQLYPAEDHVVFSVQDSFLAAATFMRGAVRQTTPGHVTYQWDPTTDEPDLGLGATSAYWITQMVARGSGLARVDAVSGGHPDPPVTLVRSNSLDATNGPTPAVVRTLSWIAGRALAPTPTLRLDLSGLRSVTVDLAAAGFSQGEQVTVTVVTDGPATVVLGGRSVTVPSGRSVFTT